LNTWLPALINGVAIGGLYALFALSVVILHRGAMIVNFAHGNVAMVLAFISYEVMNVLGVGPWPALLICLPISALLVITIHLGVITPRRDAIGASDDSLNTLFRTLALMLLLYAIAQRIWGPGEPYVFKSLFTGAGFKIGGYRVSALQIGALGMAIALSLGLGLLVQRTNWGLLMRATSSGRPTASLLGVRVMTVELISWVIAGMLLLVVGMMFASFYSLSVNLMTAVLLQGFTAAILGGLNSFRGALVGGLFVGIMNSELAVYAGPEWQAIGALVVMMAVLLVRPAGIFGSALVERV
jgi:branched-chain amino acid transport system permease protein